jgi:hypothetical protein
LTDAREAPPKVNVMQSKLISTQKFKISGTTPTTNKNSRTGSEEKNIFKAILRKDKIDVKSSIKLNTTNKTLTTNTSILFNSKTTSTSKKPTTKQVSTNLSSAVNTGGNSNNIVNNTPTETETSLKPFNNLLSTHNLKLVSTPKEGTINKSTNNILIKTTKTSVPISVCVTSQVSKNTSKNNSKSSSRIDEKAEIMRKKIIENENRKLNMKKPHLTSTNSPSNHQLMFNKVTTSSKLTIKNNKSEAITTINSIASNKITKKVTKKDSLENLLDISNCSVKSTIRESNYYKRESEKVIDFIRKFYKKHEKYPESNIKMYKVGRVSLFITFNSCSVGVLLEKSILGYIQPLGGLWLLSHSINKILQASIARREFNMKLK